MTQVWAGGWMGGILADMGAEVIKIESNKKIDILRRTIETEGDLNRGPNFNGYNRGAKSCNLNLKNPQGLELFKNQRCRGGEPGPAGDARFWPGL